jgi:hypothetical protein
MSEHERGAYTPPTDAPLSFDARQPVRGARPMPFTLIIIALVLAGLALVVMMFYRSGVRHAGQPPQAVGAPVIAMKEPPPAEAQPQDPAAGLQIYKTEGGKAPSDAITPQFAPPPEQPQSRVTVPPPTPPVTVAQAAPAQSAPAPTLRPAISAPPPAAPVPKAEAAKPAPPPAAKPEPAKSVAVAKVQPSPAAKAAPPKAQAKAAAAPVPAAKVAGVAAVQIGAVSSQALADKAWSDAATTAPGLAAGKGKNVEKVDKDGKTLFRVQVTGFADRAAASAFCDKLKAAGKACFVK